MSIEVKQQINNIISLQLQQQVLDFKKSVSIAVSLIENIIQYQNELIYFDEKINNRLIFL